MTLEPADFDRALRRLGEALAAAGMPPPSPPESSADLDELEAAIAPLRLPDEVRRFWQRADPLTLGVETFPQLCRPDFALSAWRMDQEFPGSSPSLLLQIAYTSQSCMRVELDDGERRGGALFETYIPDGGFERRFNGLADWLAYAVSLVERGWFREVDDASGRYLVVPDPDHDEEEEASRPAPPPHAVHGTTLVIEPDVLDWPEHWQRDAGIEPADLELRGASTTIAQLLAVASTGAERATIVGRVVELMGQAGMTRVRVDDGTGILDVRCPAATTTLGPVIRDWFEFDIVIGRGEDLDELAGAELLSAYAGPFAVAEAVRRAPSPG